MNERQILEDAIRAIMFYGITKGWSSEVLKEKYKLLDIDLDVVDEVLNMGIEE